MRRQLSGIRLLALTVLWLAFASARAVTITVNSTADLK